MQTVDKKIYKIDYTCTADDEPRSGHINSVTSSGTRSLIEKDCNTRNICDLQYTVTEKVYSVNVDDFVSLANNYEQ